MTTTNLRPLEDHVLILPLTEEAVTKSGIILPETNKDQPSKWTVIAVWEWKILDSGSRAPMDVKKWDTVYFTKYAPDEIEVDIEWTKTTLLVVRHSSILAVEGNK